MNKRILHLFNEAGFHQPEMERMGIEHKFEKFAELIMQETIKQMAIQMNKFGDDQSNNPAWYKSEEAVKKHFGVKEV